MHVTNGKTTIRRVQGNGVKKMSSYWNWDLMEYQPIPAKYHPLLTPGNFSPENARRVLHKMERHQKRLYREQLMELLQREIREGNDSLTKSYARLLIGALETMRQRRKQIQNEAA
jgi:hypothetical protein